MAGQLSLLLLSKNEAPVPPQQCGRGRREVFKVAAGCTDGCEGLEGVVLDNVVGGLGGMGGCRIGFVLSLSSKLMGPCGPTYSGSWLIE
jgi:hypothetical protein